MSKIITHNDYVQMLPPNIIALEKYTKGDTKILHRCTTCNHEWRTKPYYFTGSRQSNCPKCARVKTGKKNRLTHEEFMTRIQHPELEILTEYIQISQMITVRHKTCGYEWDCTPTHIASMTSGCPSCNNRVPVTEELYVDRLNENNPTMELVGPYISMNQGPIKIRHKTCGHIWEPEVNNIVYGSGCPFCQGNGIFGVRTEYNGTMYDSQFEAFCAEHLYTVFSPIEIEEQKVYINTRMTCDFHIPKLNLWIEVSTFNSQKYMDKIQRKRLLVESLQQEFIFVNSKSEMVDLITKLQNRQIIAKDINYDKTV